MRLAFCLDLFIPLHDPCTAPHTMGKKALELITLYNQHSKQDFGENVSLAYCKLKITFCSIEFHGIATQMDI